MEFEASPLALFSLHLSASINARSRLVELLPVAQSDPVRYLLRVVETSLYPSERVREVPLSDPGPLLEELGRLALPIVPESAMGLDGATWTLVISRGFNSVRLSWWGDLPDGWGALGRFLSQVDALLRGDTGRLPM